MPPSDVDIPSKTVGFSPAAGVAALVLPGSGQFLNGERSRGLWAGAGILGLFFGGMFIGGIDCIDSQEDRLWFLLQAPAGAVAFGVDYIHQHHLKVLAPGNTKAGILRSANPGEGRGPDGVVTIGGVPPYIKSMGKANEMGTLFTSIAGMLNLIVFIDAAFPSRRRPGQP